MLHKPLVAHVDDDQNNLSAYAEFLADEFNICSFQTPDALFEAIHKQKFDCFLLDIKLSGSSGFDVFDRIREEELYRSTPIFFITGSPEDYNHIEILRKGVADVFDRFVHRDELVARLKSKILAYKEYKSLLVIGSLVLDRAKLECRMNNQRITLTLLEFKILVKMASDHPLAISRDVLTSYVWGGDSVSANSLNTHLYNLRTKLKDWEYEIAFDKNSGFFFSPNKTQE